MVLMFAALTHDLGKPATTEFIDGRWRSRGHCESGVPYAEAFLKSIGCLPRIIERVLPLVAEHLTHVRDEHTPRTIRRLAVRLQPATIRELLLVIEADMGGRPPLPKGLPPQAIELRNVADSLDLQLNKPQPIVMGRHLLERGWTPGPEMGQTLRKLYEMQLDGEFSTLEQGIAFALCSTS